MKLEDTIQVIKPLDAIAMSACKRRWNQIAKPIGSLGKLEDIFIQMAGIMRTADIRIDKKTLIVMCADNGVVEEGVTQTDSDVTAVVTNNFAAGATSACIMAKRAGVDVLPVDIGVRVDTRIYTDKVAFGTNNISKGPAMTRDEARQAIEIGIAMVSQCKEKGCQIIATGEMGIGNTTTSSAMAAVLLEAEVKDVTGKGAGLSAEGLDRKQATIKRAIEVNQPDKKDPLDVLSKVGGLDIAGLVGVYLGGAAMGVPIIIDGFISAVAALTASRFSGMVRSYAIPSHMSEEPAMKQIMAAMFMEPCLNCGMRLGEGTGALTLMPLLDMAHDVYEQMHTFREIAIEPYEPMGCQQRL